MKRRKKQGLSPVKSLLYVIGLVVRVPKVLKKDGLTVILRTGKADTSLVAVVLAKNARNILLAGLLLAPVKSAARGNLGARKLRKRKMRNYTELIYTE